MAERLMKKASAAQLGGSRMAAGTAAQKDAVSNRRSASSEKKVLPSGDSLRVMEVEIAAKMMLTQLRQLQ